MTAMYGSQKPLLDARIRGGVEGLAPANTTSKHYFYPDTTMLFNGVQTYAWDSHRFDNLKMESQYNAGTVEAPVWLRYKKFGKSWYLAPNFLTSIVLFPANIFLGTRLVFTYDNRGLEDVAFFVNLFTFNDRVKVNTSTGEQGEDW